MLISGPVEDSLLRLLPCCGVAAGASKRSSAQGRQFNSSGGSAHIPRFRSAAVGGRAVRRTARSGCKQAPVLVVLCGPSHSGKTTLAEQLGDRFQVINSDAIRKRLTGKSGPLGREEKVWGTFEAMKLKALQEGRSVVLDACHMSRRARWHSLQGPNAGHRKVCVLFDLPLAVVLARCREAGRLPPEEVERMWRAFQAIKPTPAELRREGYDEVHVVME